MKICDFTVPELEKFRSQCNFTKDEMALFDARSQAKTIEECAELMNISTSTAKRISKRVSAKMKRI